MWGPKSRPGVFNVLLLSANRISGLSFDSSFLSALLVFCLSTRLALLIFMLFVFSFFCYSARPILPENSAVFVDYKSLLFFSLSFVCLFCFVWLLWSSHEIMVGNMCSLLPYWYLLLCKQKDIIYCCCVYIVFLSDVHESGEMVDGTSMCKPNGGF